jgi:hypothetical protein
LRRFRSNAQPMATTIMMSGKVRFRSVLKT